MVSFMFAKCLRKEFNGKSLKPRVNVHWLERDGLNQCYDHKLSRGSGDMLPWEIFIFGPFEITRNTSKTAHMKKFTNLYW